MPALTNKQLVDALLTIVAAIPTDVLWNVVAVHGLGVGRAPGWSEAETNQRGALERGRGRH